MFKPLAAAGLALTLAVACKPPAPPSQPADLNTADRCYRDGNFVCAASNYYGYLQAYPGDTRVMAMEAFSLTRSGQHRKARYWYQKAEAAGIGNYDFDANYARTLEALGDLDGAIKYNRRALDLVPSLVDVRGDLASQLVRKGQSSEALKLLKSFDADLVSKEHPPYFSGQIRTIEDQVKGGS
jgi:tetratricopeptide (TPR) repeat protein